MHNINQQTCKRCNLCFEICPAHAIIQANGSPAQFDSSKLHLCVKCGQCMAICSTQSISVPGLTYGIDVKPLSNNHRVDYESFYNLMLSRRSIRNFSAMPVSKMVIEKVINALSLAPYGAESDTISVTVINDRKIIEEALPHMSVFFNNIKKWLKNPFIRYMMKRSTTPGTFNTLKYHILPMIKAGHYTIADGIDNITRNAPVLIILHAKKGASEAVEDGHIKLTYGLLAAHSLGLGATAIGLVPPAVNKDENVRRIFKIPESDEAIASFIVGYPKYHFKNGIIRSKFKVRFIC